MAPSASVAIVRPARREQAAAILALRRAMLEEGRWFVTRPGEYRVSRDQLAATLASLAADAGSLALAALIRGRVVGFLAIHGERLAGLRHVGRLDMLVEAGSRGEGVGTALLTEAIRQATASAVLHKLSLAVFADNEAALALYRRQGFVQEGRRRAEYRLPDGSWRDDLLLARWVGPEGPA